MFAWTDQNHCIIKTRPEGDAKTSVGTIIMLTQVLMTPSQRAFLNADAESPISSDRLGKKSMSHESPEAAAEHHEFENS